MKIIFSKHALGQMQERGATRSEVSEAITEGEKISAKKGRLGFRLNVQYDAKWAGKHYKMKQVMPIVVGERRSYVVVTVYVFYF